MGLQLYVTQPNISRSHCGSQIEERAAVPGGPIRVWGEAALSDRRWRGTRPCRPDGHSPGVAWWKDSWLRDQTRLSSNPGTSVHAAGAAARSEAARESSGLADVTLCTALSPEETRHK